VETTQQTYTYQVADETYNVKLYVGSYSNGRIAIQLHDVDSDVENGEGLVLTVTVNLVDEDIAKDEAAIKTYSENEGVLAFLLENNIVHEPERYANAGHTRVPVCRIQEHILAQQLPHGS
jgi:hypothetical protein